MAYIQYLNFDGEDLPLPDSYEVALEDIESEAGGETEAGTTQRDVVRVGVVTISVSFSVSPKWLIRLTQHKQKKKLKVRYFNPGTLDTKDTEMYIEGYHSSLMKDTSYKGLWKVSFTLKEF